MSGWVLWVIAALVVTSLVGLLVRGRVRRSRRRDAPAPATGPAALIGKRAIVLEEIVNDEGVGCITVDGEVWTARAFEAERVIERGTLVEVVDIRGATALVLE